MGFSTMVFHIIQFQQILEDGYVLCAKKLKSNSWQFLSKQNCTKYMKLQGTQQFLFYVFAMWFAVHL